MAETGQDKPCGSGIEVFNIWNVAATAGNHIHPFFSPKDIDYWNSLEGKTGHNLLGSF